MLTGHVTDEPRYLAELSQYVEEHLDDPTSLIAAFAALLSDPAAYVSSKGQPSGPLGDFVQEQILRNRPLQKLLQDSTTPVSRALIDEKWCAVWREARAESKPSPSPEYDVCVSFAGSDREIARRIAEAIAGNGMNRKIFYDEFEKTNLWGEELFKYLYKMYSQRSKFCLILFSHAYRQRAWTRHELRAAQTRTLLEQQAYMLPVALEKGAVPEEFATVGYWSFNPGDESRIAEATEEKINDYIGEHLYSIDLIADILRRDAAAAAMLDAFKLAINHRLASDDPTGAQALMTIALIVIADMANAKKSVRAIVNLVLFSPGPVGDIFNEEDRLIVAGSASVRRWLGKDGPFLFSDKGWDEFLEPYRRHFESLSDNENADDDDEDSEDPNVEG